VRDPGPPWSSHRGPVTHDSNRVASPSPDSLAGARDGEALSVKGGSKPPGTSLPWFLAKPDPEATQRYTGFKKGLASSDNDIVIDISVRTWPPAVTGRLGIWYYYFSANVTAPTAWLRRQRLSQTLGRSTGQQTSIHQLKGQNMSSSTQIAKSAGRLVRPLHQPGTYWIVIIVILLLVRSWSYQQIAALQSVVAIFLILSPATSRNTTS
jgi:hypothetical protein